MQHRVTRQPAGEQGGPRPDDDAGLSAELVAVVAGARRRAVRDGDRQIDTAHLLHSLLESDPEVRSVVGDAPQLARLLGYLVQRSIGYGLRWQGTVEDSGALAVVPDPALYGGDPREAGAWSPAAAVAMEDARRRARRRTGARAGGPDLLAALVTDPGSRAVEVLERAGIPTRELRARIEGGGSGTAGSGGAEIGGAEMGGVGIEGVGIEGAEEEHAGDRGAVG
ncbi:Clp protease N-terminal domain-containing protein [Streptomyces collinus]|uniref:Clp protease N-terminal domain-containing protein n=1 Tax=Streptomyces collinus TaxID=42684 RepID=UPI0036F11483